MTPEPLEFPVGPAWSFLAASASVLVVCVSSAGTVVAANLRATTLLGRPLLGEPWAGLFVDCDTEQSLADLAARAAAPRRLHVGGGVGGSQTLQITVASLADGYVLFGEENAAEQANFRRECEDLNQDLNHLSRELALQNAELGLYREHLETMVKERTADLAHASKTFRDIHSAMSDAGICVLWADSGTGRLIYVNESTARMLGYCVDELLDLSIPDIDANTDHARFLEIEETVRERGSAQYESVLRCRDGRQIPVQVSLCHREGDGDLSPHTIAFMIDISARKAVERALIESQRAAQAAQLENAARHRAQIEAKLQSRKMEAVGTLAAGVAHDFNNILGSIVGFAEMTLDDLAAGSRAKRNIEQLLRASFRARDLIAHILAFARESPTTPVPVDVTATVRESLALLRASLPPAVQLSFESGIPAGAPAMLLADPTQVQQIVMNLCINAAHAMSGHGLIRVRLDPADRIDSVQPAYVGGMCLTVADGGSGITPEVLERMFDPFFTTKAPGEGSGLGLSVVYGVVTDLGGVIQVKSCVDGDSRGTEFRVFLPSQRVEQHSEVVHGANIAH